MQVGFDEPRAPTVAKNNYCNSVASLFEIQVSRGSGRQHKSLGRSVAEPQEPLRSTPSKARAFDLLPCRRQWAVADTAGLWMVSQNKERP